WLEWSRDGWTSGTHFVFGVMTENGRVAAACDIKSPDAMAEGGYWASGAHRGVMTNALKAGCRLASEGGCRGLFGRTHEGDVRSVSVLLRAGFVDVAPVQAVHKRLDRTLDLEL